MEIPKVVYKRLKQFAIQPKPTYGFTIVELLVVIVVIGILAAITIVSYTGISQKATIASLSSDLDNASKQIKLYYIDHGIFPTSFDTNNCPLDPTSTVDNRYCVKFSPDTTYQYTPNGNVNPPYFCISGAKSSNVYRVTNDGTLSSGDCTSSGLVGYWPFNGTGNIINNQTTSLQDLSGNNNGTASNLNGTGMAFVTGKVGNAVRFDGVDDYVNTAYSASLNFTNNFTVEAWIKGDSFSGYDIIVKGGNGTADWEFGVQGANKLELGEAAWGSYWNRHIYSDVISFNPNQWYHVAVVYNTLNKTADFYRDGVAVGVGKQSVDKFGINNSGVVMIGSENFGGIIGVIDEVRVYNRALSSNEIKAAYDSTK